MVFPIGDDNSDRASFPILNTLLILANILVFLFLQRMGENLEFTFAYSCVPAEILSGRDMVTEPREVSIPSSQGSVQVMVPGLQPTPIPVYLTILTSIFMHGGWAHVLGNMWFLWIFGDNIEHSLGKLKYLVFYLLCGIFASLAHVILNTSGAGALTPSLGASGAISGVMGAYLVLYPHRRVTVIMMRVITEVPAYFAVGIWFVFQIISGIGLLGDMDSGVAYGAHIGGFAVGAMIIKPMMLGRKPASPSYSHQRWV